jgi:hypothetical protein
LMRFVCCWIAVICSTVIHLKSFEFTI